MYSSDCPLTSIHKIVDVGKIGSSSGGDGRQCLYRRQGLTSRASIIFTTSQILLSGYASFPQQSETQAGSYKLALRDNGLCGSFSTLVLFYLFSLIQSSNRSLSSLSHEDRFLKKKNYFLSCHNFISWLRHCLFTSLQFLSVPSEREKKIGFSRLWSRAIESLPPQTICFPVVPHISTNP